MNKLLSMDKIQYEFSNMFWSDQDFDLEHGIPKDFTMEDGEMIYTYLNEKETQDFMKLKSKEDPEVLNHFRYKKLKRILNK